MSQLTYAKIDQTVLNTLTPPKKYYWGIVFLLFLGVMLGASCWAYQIFTGIGVGGQNNPVAWGTYLINFVFWVGIAIFNLALWAPLPIELNRSFLYLVAFLALIVALVVPIIGIKKHQVIRELLKVNKEIPKKKTINEKARVYIDQVKNLDRPLLNVEIELLKDSKWAAKPEEDPAKDSVKE